MIENLGFPAFEVLPDRVSTGLEEEEEEEEVVEEEVRVFVEKKRAFKALEMRWPWSHSFGFDARKSFIKEKMENSVMRELGEIEWFKEGLSLWGCFSFLGEVQISPVTIMLFSIDSQH